MESAWGRSMLARTSAAPWPVWHRGCSEEQHTTVAAKIVQFLGKDGEALHDPLHAAPVSGADDDASTTDMQQKVAELQEICEQLEEVRLQAQALRERLSSEMAETSRRQRFEPQPLSAKAADIKPSK